MNPALFRRFRQLTGRTFWLVRLRGFSVFGHQFDVELLNANRSETFGLGGVRRISGLPVLENAVMEVTQLGDLEWTVTWQSPENTLTIDFERVSSPATPGGFDEG